MPRDDRKHWDSKYAAGNPNPTFDPDPLLVQFSHLLNDRGWALDLACGVAHNALFLARRGYDVVAVDTSLTALRYARDAVHRAGLPVHLVAADVDDFVLPAATFAVVIVFRFLNRALVPHIKQSLAPGGLLIYQTFNTNHLRVAPQMRREYVLEPGELKRLLSGLETIATNDSDEISDTLTYWIGKAPR